MSERNVLAVLKLEVPIVVRLGRRQMRTSEVMALTPGTIIELPKTADEELELLVNNKEIGLGSAVKIGENFGLRVSYIGDVRERLEALGGQRDEGDETELDAVAQAEALLAGQV